MMVQQECARTEKGDNVGELGKAAVSLSGRKVFSRMLNHGKCKSRQEGGTVEKPRTERMPTNEKHSRKNVETKAQRTQHLPHSLRNWCNVGAMSVATKLQGVEKPQQHDRERLLLEMHLQEFSWEKKQRNKVVGKNGPEMKVIFTQGMLLKSRDSV